MGCALIPAPCNFSLPSYSFLLLLHLTVAPSSLYHYRFLLSFSFFTTFSIQDRPFTLSRQSITLISAAYCYHFITTLFSRTPFGTYSTRAHTRKSTIHSFILQLRPAKILHYKNKNPTDSRHRSARRSLASTSASKTIRLLFIPTPSAYYLATCPRRALCSRIHPGPPQICRPTS
jgi:hypothetical protein